MKGEEHIYRGQDDTTGTLKVGEVGEVRRVGEGSREGVGEVF